jgi:hypothetical protein
MVKIKVTELSPAGSSLFSEAESFTESVKDLTAEELSATKGGGKSSKRGFFFGGFPGGFGGFPGGFGGGFGGFGGGITIINNNNNNNGGGGFVPSQPSPPPVPTPKHPW